MIRIITDSTADFVNAENVALNVPVVPLKVIFGDTEYLDGVDLSNAEFYEKLINSDVLPTTSQPSPEAFMKEFAIAKEAGDEVICITVSSKLSGTYQSANIAKDILEYDKIHIVDSTTVTIGLQFVVRLAQKMVDEGKSVDEILEVVNDVVSRLEIYAIIDDLSYLCKGGRLSTSSAMMGKLLGIKPLIAIADGEISVYAKTKGMKAAYAKLVKAAENMEFSYSYGIAYSPSLEAGAPFIEYVEERLGKASVVCPIGAAIGTHAGPGALGFAVLRAK